MSMYNDILWRNDKTTKAYVVTVQRVSPSSLKTSNQGQDHFLVLDMKKMERKLDRQTRRAMELGSEDIDARIREGRFFLYSGRRAQT